MLQQIVAILLVLALLAGTLTLLRRRGLAQVPFGISRSASRGKQMQLLERISLSPNHSLHLVGIRDEVYVIGVAQNGFHTIATFGSPVKAGEFRENG